jgi:hypothetical protein
MCESARPPDAVVDLSGDDGGSEEQWKLVTSY